MIQNILIPTDGSDYGKTAIAYGIYIARKLDAQLIGLHVVDIRLIRGPVFTDISGSVGLPPYQEFLPAIESGLEAKADAILQDFRGQCEAAGVHPETMKVTGVIDETIIEEGRKCCDWILLAQRGEHFHIDGGAILGSTAQSVVRRSGKPVLVTPEHFREIESMAVAYDGSAPAHKALKLAAELSERAAWPLSVVIITSDPSVGEKISKTGGGIPGVPQDRQRHPHPPGQGGQGTPQVHPGGGGGTPRHGGLRTQPLPGTPGRLHDLLGHPEEPHSGPPDALSTSHGSRQETVGLSENALLSVLHRPGDQLALFRHLLQTRHRPRGRNPRHRPDRPHLLRDAAGQSCRKPPRGDTGRQIPFGEAPDHPLLFRRRPVCGADRIGRRGFRAAAGR